nr:MAG TPA: hypothetical protein [Herelleviridae sp.]
MPTFSASCCCVNFRAFLNSLILFVCNVFSYVYMA